MKFIGTEFLSRFSPLVTFIWEFQVFNWTVFCTLNFWIINLRRPLGFVCLVYSLSLVYSLLEKRTKMGTNLTYFKYDLSQNNWPVSLTYTRGFTTFIFHSLNCIILSGCARRRNYQISSAFSSYFPMFSLMLFLLVKQNGNHVKNKTVLFGFICPPNSLKTKTTYLILLIQFSWLLSQLRKLVMGRWQFHTGEEGQGGNFRNTRRAAGSRWVLLDPISS